MEKLIHFDIVRSCLIKMVWLLFLVFWIMCDWSRLVSCSFSLFTCSPRFIIDLHVVYILVDMYLTRKNYLKYLYSRLLFFERIANIGNGERLGIFDKYYKIYGKLNCFLYYGLTKYFNACIHKSTYSAPCILHRFKIS
jgi:hypothetical protein